jgi:hypothetical protein
LKIEETLSDYLSCEILFNKDWTKIWIGQPHMIKKIEKTFGEMVKRNQNYRTPCTPHHQIVKPTKEMGKLTDEEQKLYRTGVGMLLYLVKYSRPDISNAVRECLQPTPTNASNQCLQPTPTTNASNQCLQPTWIKWLN